MIPMKEIIIRIVVIVIAFVTAQANAGEFDGPYIAAKLGYNKSTITNTASSTGDFYLAGEAGYTQPISQNTLVGIALWGDAHATSVTGYDYGADLKVGLVQNNVLYYAKLGGAATPPGSRAHYGLGAEYKLDKHLGLIGEWTADAKTVNSIKYKNNNVTVGLVIHI